MHTTFVGKAATTVLANPNLSLHTDKPACEEAQIGQTAFQSSVNHYLTASEPDHGLFMLSAQTDFASEDSDLAK